VEKDEPKRLEHLFQYVARIETDALADDYRWSRGRRRPRMPVTQTGMNLLRIWVRLYLDSTATTLSAARSPRWPRGPHRLDLEVARYLSLKPRWARTWTEHYNAACTVAVAMRGWPPEGREHRLLAMQAVRHLERAVSVTDSGYVGRYAQWLSTGDQDLNPLRQTPQFIDFLDRYLPNPGPRVRRPDELLLPLVMAHHALRLLADVCRRSRDEAAASSHERTLALLTSTHHFAENHRHWQTRAALVRLLEDRSGDSVPATVDTALPRFQDDPVVRDLAKDHVHLDDHAYFERFKQILESRDAAWPGFADRLRTERDRVAAATTTHPDGVRAFWVALWEEVQRFIDDPLG
jgi:hypothetical protein